MAKSPENPSAPASQGGLPGPTWPWVTAGVVLFCLLWLGPHLVTVHLDLAPAARLSLQAQIRDSWAKVIWAGLTLLAAALVWRYLAQLGKVVEHSAQTLASAERNAYYASQSLASDRYARAMSLLADEHIDVRLGGIYVLERLARESQADHGPIMEVLAAYVRENAPWKEGQETQARPPADIQAISGVLGRREVSFDPEQTHLDLHGVCLARAYLPRASFANFFLYETDLSGAILQSANLRGAWMWKTNLTGTVLDGAHLEGADLTGVAGLTEVQLQNAVIDTTTKLPEHLRGIRDGQKPEARPEPTDLILPTKTGPSPA